MMAFSKDDWFAQSIAALTVAVLIYAYYKIKKMHNYFKDRNIPYLQPKYLLGSDLDGIFFRIAPCESWDQIYKRLEGHKLGGFFQIVPTLMIRDPDYVHNVLVSSFDHFVDRPFPIDEETNPMEAHIFFLKGNRWRFLRNKLSPIFSSGKLKWMFQEMDKCGDDFIQCIDEVADGKDVDLVDKLARYTTDIIGSCVFGLEGDCLKNPDSTFRRIGKDFFQSKKFNFELVTTLLKVLMPRIFLRLKIRSVSRDTENFFCSTIFNALEYRKTTGMQRKDFIQLLLQLKENGKVDIQQDELEETEKRKYNESSTERIEITDKMLAAQSLVFYLAGFETTSRTLHFLLYLLSLHKDIQDRARKEILQIKAKYGHFSYDALKEMTFVDKCISETLRLFPPVPQLNRECVKELTLPDGTLIEKGTNLLIPIFSIHRDPKIFQDPLKFNPDRFEQEPTRGTYAPFGDGPRVCIGKRFAIVEIKVVLARFLERYRFDPSPQNKGVAGIKMNRWSLVLAPDDHLNMRIHKLN